MVNSKDISTRVRKGLDAKIAEIPFRTKRDPELTVSPELISKVLRTLSVIEQKVEQPARPAPPPKQNIGRPLPSPHEPIRGDAIFRQGVIVPVDGFDPFGWIDLFAITPGEYLNYEIPSLSKFNLKRS